MRPSFPRLKMDEVHATYGRPALASSRSVLLGLGLGFGVWGLGFRV